MKKNEHKDHHDNDQSNFLVQSLQNGNESFQLIKCDTKLILVPIISSKNVCQKRYLILASLKMNLLQGLPVLLFRPFHLSKL
jgi:hypothetical protein